VLRKRLLQPLERATELALHGSGRAAQHRSDLPLLEVFVVAKSDDCPLPRWEPHHRAPRLIAIVHGLRRVRVIGGAESLPALETETPPSVLRLVRGDHPEVGPPFGLLELLDPRSDPREGLLREVLPGLPASREHHAEPEQPRVIPVEGVLKR